MRSIRDNQLPEPYRSWIDGARPLPDHVRLFPRMIRLFHDSFYLFFHVFAVVCAGILIGLMVGKDLVHARWELIIVVAAAILPFVVLAFFSLRRLWVTIGAHREARRGALRQGIFVSRDGILLRMKPNECYPLALDRFVSAKIVHFLNRGISSRSRFVIETLDEPLEFSFIEGRLTDAPVALNRHVGKLQKRVKALKRTEKRERT
jgi:hypothetical protein